MRRLITALFAALALFGCDDEEPARSSTSSSAEAPAHAAATEGTRPGAPSGATRNARAGGIAWVAPEPFRPVQPTSQMRAAEYVFPEGEGESPASLTVFFFGPGQGGSIEENVARWVGQFEQSDGTPSSQAARITEREVNGLQVTLVDVSGTYSAMTPMGSRGGPATDQRMLGAIARGPQGPVFFKMVGPREVMERAQPKFDELVSSFHAE